MAVLDETIRIHIRTELELDRTKFMAITVLFLFFGFTSVVSQLFMPEILAQSGLEIVNLPDPSIEQVLADFWGDISIMAMLVILFSMTTFSSELDVNKSGYFYLARPISRRTYYLTRFLLRVGSIMLLFFTSSLLVYLYATIYFAPIALGKVILATLLLSLYIGSVNAIVIAFSAGMSSSQTGVAGLLTVFIQLALGLVKPLKWMSPYSLSDLWQEVISGSAGSVTLASHYLALLAWIIVPGVIGLIYYLRRDLK